MSCTTFFQIAIVLGLTTSITSIKLSDHLKAIPPGSPSRYSLSLSQQDAYWLGKNLAHPSLAQIVSC